MSTILSELIGGAAEIADLGSYTTGQEGIFVTDNTWFRWLNEAVDELYQLVLAEGGEELVSIGQSFTLTTTNSVAINTEADGGFRQLLSVTRDPGTPQRRTVHRYEFAERDSQWMEPRYRLMGHTLFIEPEEQAAGSYQLLYLGGMSQFDDSNFLTPDGLGQFKEWIMVTAALKAIRKAGGSTGDVAARLEQLTADVVDYCGKMDIGEADKVTDVSDDGSWY